MSMLYIPLLTDITWKRFRKELSSVTGFCKAPDDMRVAMIADPCSSDEECRPASICLDHGEKLIYMDVYLVEAGQERPLIVAWTSFYKGTISATIHPTMDDCPYECDLVERSADNGSESSAYMLHGAYLLVSTMLERYSSIDGGLMMIEAPPNAGTFVTELPKDFFNATITYRNDSNYPLPYGKFVKRREDDDERLVITKEQIQDALPKKTKGVLLLMSHCSTNSSRESII
ncbi:hypothetical protein OSTOST_24538, partial [Ostertagia ostertagi]